MTYADHLVWPIHVPRRCEPLITPHLSLWGNSRTRATFPTHKKSHNPHPQGERGKGVNMGTLHCGGVGGVPAKPGSYIYMYIFIKSDIQQKYQNHLCTELQFMHFYTFSEPSCRRWWCQLWFKTAVPRWPPQRSTVLSCRQYLALSGAVFSSIP